MRLSSVEKESLRRFVEQHDESGEIQGIYEKLTAPASKKKTKIDAPNPRQLCVPGTDPKALVNVLAPDTAAPFLKWVGGKRQILPEIRKHVPAIFGKYHEPFVGGGAVFFDLWNHGRIRKHSAVLGDSNTLLMEAYRGVRDSVEDVIGLLGEKKYSKEEYYATREKVPTTPTEIAAWFIYLNKTCFNGLYRVNRSGGFNVPMGKYTNPKICDAEALRACSTALTDTLGIICLPFTETMAAAQRNDFIYCDPPYAPVKAESFVQYAKDGFGQAEHIALRDAALMSAVRGVYVLLSNSDTPFVRELYPERMFHLYEVSARRSVNSDGEGRGKVGELLIVPKRGGG